MIHFREPDEVTIWLLAFHTHATTWWARLVPGRFKHVSAFGYSAKAKTWVFIDPSMFGMQVWVLPDGNDAEDKIARNTEGAAVLKVTSGPRERLRFRPAVCCTSVLSHLTGVRGALLPDRLWKQCLANGATVVHEVTGPAAD